MDVSEIFCQQPDDPSNVIGDLWPIQSRVARIPSDSGCKQKSISVKLLGHFQS
jgi:hypothetical protein